MTCVRAERRWEAKRCPDWAISLTDCRERPFLPGSFAYVWFYFIFLNLVILEYRIVWMEKRKWDRANGIHRGGKSTKKVFLWQ